MGALLQLWSGMLFVPNSVALHEKKVLLGVERTQDLVPTVKDVLHLLKMKWESLYSWIFFEIMQKRWIQKTFSRNAWLYSWKWEAKPVSQSHLTNRNWSPEGPVLKFNIYQKTVKEIILSLESWVYLGKNILQDCYSFYCEWHLRV